MKPTDGSCRRWTETGTTWRRSSAPSTAAKDERGRPSLIKLRTHIGYGSSEQAGHRRGARVASGRRGDRADETAVWLGSGSTFVVSRCRTDASSGGEIDKGTEREANGTALFERYAAAFPGPAKEFRAAASGALPGNWEEVWRNRAPRFDPATSLATREAQGKVLDAVMPNLPWCIGGSADLTPSNNTRFKGAADFSQTGSIGRYIRFGVREHAMGAILNGIARQRYADTVRRNLLLFLRLHASGRPAGCAVEVSVDFRVHP